MKMIINMGRIRIRKLIKKYLRNVHQKKWIEKTLFYLKPVSISQQYDASEACINIQKNILLTVT